MTQIVQHRQHEAAQTADDTASVRSTMQVVAQRQSQYDNTRLATLSLHETVRKTAILLRLVPVPGSRTKGSAFPP